MEGASEETSAVTPSSSARKGALTIPGTVPPVLAVERKPTRACALRSARASLEVMEISVCPHDESVRRTTFPMANCVARRPSCCASSEKGRMALF